MEARSRRRFFDPLQIRFACSVWVSILRAMSDVIPSSPSDGLSSSPAAEKVLWEGTPSSWQNFWWWVSIIGIPVAIWNHLVLKSTLITLTTQRLKITSGVFNKQREEIELYRVRDWTFHEPFFQRMLGFGTVSIVSSDRTAPEVTYKWIEGARALTEQLRAAVEAVRDRKRVRSLEVDDEDSALAG